MEQENKPYISFYLSEKEKELVQYISKKLGLSMSAFIRLAILKKAREENFILKQSIIQQNGTTK